MNRYLTITILGSLAFGCGDNEVPPLPTWGESVADTSIAFCEARERCGWAHPSEYEECVELNVDNLCERWDCDLIIQDDDAEIFAQCAADLADESWCGPFLPYSCYEMLELKQ